MAAWSTGPQPAKPGATRGQRLSIWLLDSQLLRDFLGPLEELRVDRLMLRQLLLRGGQLVQQLAGDVGLLHPGAEALLGDLSQGVGVVVGADGADGGFDRQFVLKL